MQPTDAQLACFRRLFLAHDPPYQAWIQPPGAAAKYLEKFHSISDVELTAHLAGGITIAAPLLRPDGTAHACALDVDQGGVDALEHLLAAARARGLTAMAFTSAHTRHNGGHVWLLFDSPAAPDRLRHLADELAAAVHVDAETYPSGKTLRLPLGLHRGSGRRGTLLLPDRTMLDLDAGDAAIATALTVLDALPRNTTTDLPPIPEVPPQTRAQTHQDGSGAAGRCETRIAAYNAATDLLSLLMGYGGRIAVQYRNGTVVLHCPCGQHRNGDAHASLEIQPARNPRYGRHVAVGYATGCAFSLEQRRVVDAFAVYCTMEQLQPADAIRSLRGRLGTIALPACPPSPAAEAGVPGGIQLALDADGGAS